MSNSNVKKGDIVWVRIKFPHQWFPALVLHSNNFAVSISFFNLNPPNPFNFSSYFLHSDVIPFEQNFHTIINNTNPNEICEKIFHLLLDSALRLLGQRVISSLSCRCCFQLGIKRKGLLFDSSSSYCFDPIGVLSFVLKGSVFPWVHITDFAYAVRVVAQVHVFRSYCFVQQKKVYKETTKRGDDVKLHPCLSLGQKMHLVTQESLDLESKDEDIITSKRGEKNMAIGAIRKRKRLDEPSLHDCSLTTQRILSFSSMNEVLASLQKTTSGKKDDSDVSISSSVLANCFSSCDGKDMDLYKAFFLQSPMKSKIQNLSSGQGFSVTLTCENTGADCDMALLKEASCHIFPQSGQVHEIEGNPYKSTCTRPCISQYTDEVQKVDLRKCQNLTLQPSFACDSLSNLVPGFCFDNYEVDASALKMNGMLGRNSSILCKRLQLRSNDDATPLERKKSAREKLSSVDCLVEDKDHYQCVASCSIFNSKVGQQSRRTHVPICSTFLYMKFPKTFNLPSKRVLIKKFSVFGPIDSSKTRLFSDTNSAQVAFFHEADAVAAHLYAKKKKVPFGVANIRFWLDPNVQKRRGFKHFAFISSSARKPIGPLLKSCLKQSNSLRQEDGKKHYRVRFIVET
ncbi:putative non-specific serine/threonine protein kinase [Lupinus albus]|uniref:Putative non-specific serine/threonine protein kinase n=1 Tax=Lupinus albus TaxID=3870 RepID=A0A6A4NJR8_LUPAL|nr:putative non-specific serine/threonine protein kinase [Lupinus albus]